MKFEIYSYGGGDFLRLIFNGITQIFGAANYMMALKTSALLGFLGVLITAAFHKGKLDLHWLLGIVMIFMLLIVPKTHVIINDRLIPVNSAVVENIPIGISATASTFSLLSDWLTRTFETVFSLPNVAKYRGNGLLFAQALVEESTRFEITTPRLSVNFSEFWKSCVYYDLLLGLYSWDQVLKAPDLENFFLSNTSQTRGFSYEQSNNEREIFICREGFEKFLKSDLEEEIKSSTNIQGSRLVPNSSNKNEAIERFSNAMPVAYQYLTGLSLSNAKIISQNILANSFKRGLINFASDADAAAAAEDFSLAKAEAERRTTFSVMGKLAKKMLPILHNIFEAFIYAIFPIVMLMAMLPSAVKILSKYAMALFWINLWPPLYAILNFAISYHGQKAASSAMIHSGAGLASGLSVMTNTGLGNVLSDYAAITGYLSLSIPMIAWILISASGAMMAGLAGRMMDGYDRPVSSAASEASSGNVSIGQFSYDNKTAFQGNSAPQSTSGSMNIKGEDGIASTITSQGSFLSAPASSLPVSINLGESATSAIRDNYSKNISNDSSTMNESLHANQYLQDEKSAKVDTITNSKNYSESFSESERLSLAHSNEKTDGIVETFAKNEGLSSRTVKAMRAAIEGHAGAGPNIGIAKIQGSINAGTSGSKEKVSSENIEKLMQVMSSDKYNQALREEATNVKDLLAKIDSGQSNNQSKAFSESINRQEQVSQRRSIAIKKMESASHLMENSSQFSTAINETGTDGFINWMVNEKGIPEQDVKTLISNYNKGDIGAKKSFHDLAKNYVSDHIEKMSLNLPTLPPESKLNTSQLPTLKQTELNWDQKQNFETLKSNTIQVQHDPSLLEKKHPQTLKMNSSIQTRENETKEEWDEKKNEDNFIGNTANKVYQKAKNIMNDFNDKNQ
jgi:conjugal transfer mating pair stabilization protein TraG